MRRYPQFFDPQFPARSPRAVWPPGREPELELEEPPAPVPPPAAVQDERVALREAAARMDAARARVERDAARAVDESQGKLVEQLLPVLDSLDRSIAASGDQGNQQIRAQLEGVLAKFGMERFDAPIGGVFDPREHEAVAVTDVEPARAGTVTAQWEAGYRRAGRLLRPARVQVGRHRS